MKARINAISSITHQDSFRSEDIYSTLKVLDDESDIISPDFKEFIPPAALRRLSPVLRIAMTCAIECQNQVSTEFDSISVGTALGCLKDTEKFLVTFITATSDTLSPTSFIQSTHNTIAGQISLALNNHAYNMTHTQNNLSFEVALIDAFLCIEDGKKSVLAGAADEKIEFLEAFQGNLIRNDQPLASGATFMALGDVNSTGIGIVDVKTHFTKVDTAEVVQAFLKSNGLEPNDISFVAYSDEEDYLANYNCEKMNYLEFSGIHYSASAFATHIAHDYLKNKDAKFGLIVNTVCEGNTGLILLKNG